MYFCPIFENWGESWGNWHFCCCCKVSLQWGEYQDSREYLGAAALRGEEKGHLVSAITSAFSWYRLSHRQICRLAIDLLSGSKCAQPCPIFKIRYKQEFLRTCSPPHPLSFPSYSSAVEYTCLLHFWQLLFVFHHSALAETFSALLSTSSWLMSLCILTITVTPQWPSYLTAPHLGFLLLNEISCIF